MSPIHPKDLAPGSVDPDFAAVREKVGAEFCLAPTALGRCLLPAGHPAEVQCGSGGYEDPLPPKPPARQLHLPPELSPAEQRAKREELDSARRWVDGEIERIARELGTGQFQLRATMAAYDYLTPLCLLSEWLRRR